MAKNTNPVLDLFRENFDSGDSYGSTINALFDIAECLTRYHGHVPEHWEYSPGMAAYSPADTLTEEDDGYFACELDLLARQGYISQIIHAGNVLERYDAQLRLAGEDY